MIALVDKFGRVVIPKKFRTHLGLAPGTELDIEEEGNRLVLEPVSREPLLVRDGEGLVYRGKLLEDVDASSFLKREREERARKIMARSIGK
jgi:AbrB family looped-hinge helix DNA binding protein